MVNVPLPQKMKKRVRSGDPVEPTETEKIEAGDVDIVESGVSFEYPQGEKEECSEDDADIDDDDNLTIHTFVAVVGFQFYNTPCDDSEEMREQKFMMKTFDQEKEEYQRDIYGSSQIQKDFMFDDGPVIYPNDTIPKLDRESLGWDARLIGEKIKSTWTVRRVKTFYSGLVQDYDNISQQHTVLWDDKTTDSFDVMGTWHKQIIEWRLYDEEEKLLQCDSKKSRTRTTTVSVLAATEKKKDHVPLLIGHGSIPAQGGYSRKMFAEAHACAEVTLLLFLMTYSIHEILSLTITPTLTQTLLNIVYIYMRCYRNRMYICLSNPDTSHKKVTVAMASASGRVHVRQLTQDEEKEVSLTLTLTLLNPNPNRNPKLKPRRFLETPTLTPTATPTLTSNLNFNPNSNFSCKL